MVFRKVYIVLCAALLAAGDLCAQQVRVEPRIAGLEGNREYMSLLEQDAQLQIREDSIVNAVECARQQLREDPANRQRYSQEILELESRIFEVRNAKGRLIDKINTIEQEWVLANLNGAAQQPAEPAAESPAGAIPDSLKVRNLVFNPYFREQLPEADYAALRRAQGLELDAVDYVNRYFANYGTICELAEAYAAAQTEADAGEIYDRYNTLQGFNRVLADSLAEAWNYIADNKGYAYGYLMDKLGQDAILAREEKRLSGAARELSALRGEVASDAVADYFLRKKVLVGYETAVAGLLPPATRCAAWLRNWMASTSACPVSTWRSAISSTTTVSRSPRRQNTATSTRSPSAGSTSTGRSTVSCWARSIPSVPSPRSGGRIRSPIWSARIRNGATMPGASQPGRRPRPRKNS